MSFKKIGETLTTLIILFICYYIYVTYFEDTNTQDTEQHDNNKEKDKNDDTQPEDPQKPDDETTPPVVTPDTLPQKQRYTYLKDYLPASSKKNQVVQHSFYALSYSETDEQAEWVAYELTKDRIRSEKRVERSDNFRPDPQVKTGSATLSDYKGSGYDRGHICPAGDMGFDEKAMSETFYMSNMSPQLRSCNRGVWRELEESVRDWAVANKRLYVVTGPLLKGKALGKIGANEVTIPTHYYKALLDLSDPDQKAIAFLVPNERRGEHLHDFTMTIDELEKRTGIDFFPNLPDAQEATLESKINPFRWMIDADRYQMRLSRWNNE